MGAEWAVALCRGTGRRTLLTPGGYLVRVRVRVRVRLRMRVRVRVRVRWLCKRLSLRVRVR